MAREANRQGGKVGVTAKASRSGDKSKTVMERGECCNCERGRVEVVTLV